MGLSFSRIEKELASRRFQEVFSDLRTECPSLCSFADPDALIGFFHDATADQKTKNAIVGSLISLCRRGIGQHYLVLLVIMFLAPVLVKLYTQVKRRQPGYDKEDFYQDTYLQLIHVLNTIKVVPHKVIGQIVGNLKNRLRDIRARGYEQGAFEIPECNFFVPLQDMEAGAFHDLDCHRAVEDTGPPDALDFLDHLVSTRIITRSDRQLIMATLAQGKSLRDMASSPTEYERLKKRRQRVLETIRKSFRKYLNS